MEHTPIGGVAPGAALARSVGAAAAVVVVLAAGLWFWGGVVAPGYTSSIVLSVLWFVVAGVALGRLAGRAPALRRAIRGTFLVTSLAAAVGFYWTSIRDDRVNETVVTGVPASRAGGGSAAPAAGADTNVELLRGDVRTRAHSSRGTATVVAVAGAGRVLTLTDFETDNGPDLRVYLVRGPVADDGDVDDFVDLGRLKGNVGDQQYTIPDATDVAAYSTVLVWCRAFSVAFAQADLRGA